ncbi:hypothetical protein CXB51_035799 [Gossypium anomalum]|uniref:Reverse transcriptase domain-containing protein n=1 Tax=Gossypium anomalum TaxID=47600 RepID=A0A8J6CMV1_9ROSI|nr:hypothetical protein CXB51_035799 [Gossypium anomalum]
MGDVNERIDDVNDRVTDGLYSMKEQQRDYVLDSVQKLTGRDDAIRAMMTTLKEEITKLKGELIIYKATLGNGGFAAVASKPNVDVSKPKEFKETRWVETMGEARVVTSRSPRAYQCHAALSAIKEMEEVDEIGNNLGSILGGVKDKTSHGLMFVDIVVAGKELSTLVDTDVSDLFMSEEVAHKLGLNIQNKLGRIKTGCNAPKLPKSLPLKWEVDHKIELVSNMMLLAKTPYLLFSKETYESLRMCIDYRDLNKITMKNRYPIPFITDLFNQFSSARWFTKLGLRLGYHQVQITEEDELKTASVMRYGSYEFLVMPFGLTNAPATFCTLMNKILEPFIYCSVVVYFDDIVVYSRLLDEHMEHLREVFQILKENKLFANEEKYSFAQQEVPFLGHIVRGGKIRVDERKIWAIVKWEPPTKVTELKSFLGLANYY